MLNQSALIAFIATTNSDQARNFYERGLGLTLVEDESFALVFDAKGIMLRVQKVQAHTPAPFTVLGWDVADIQAEVGELRGRGIIFEQYNGLSQDDQGIWTASDGTKVAWFKDPDGNLLSLTQFYDVDLVQPGESL